MEPAIFLDRDGVLIENLALYVRSWEDVHIFPQALAALACIRASPYKIILVTNQSAVGRGLISLEAAWEINKQLVKVIEQAGGRIDGVFMCPHSPEEGCACRKPEPGLLLQAARELSVDLSRSILIGDALSDIQAGQAAGVGKTVLVRTGRGSMQAGDLMSGQPTPDFIFENLQEALSALIACS